MIIKNQADEIYSKLKNRDHVRSLVSEIKGNQGLLEPIIVRNGDCCFRGE